MSTSVENGTRPIGEALPLEQQAGASGSPRHRTVTLRAFLVGLIGVIFICWLTPFNDYVLGNTFLVGNFLPIGLLLYLLVVILLNAPLNRFVPRMALSSGELALALSMTMVSCALPSSGLMRYLPTGLVGITHHGAANAEYDKLLTEMRLPKWIFPATDKEKIADRPKDDAIKYYMARVPAVDDTFSAHWSAVPWKLWQTPAVRWGLLVGGLFGAVMCMSALVRHQWAENERLAFPLANVYMSLIEAPPKGKAFNSLFAARGFWIAFALVFFIHSLNALNLYWPKYFPKLPINFDMNAIFNASEPWRYASYGFKAASIYFCIVGFTFFIQTKIAFSLWFTYILVQIGLMGSATMGAEMKWDARADQTMGAMVPVALSILWVGRQQWLAAARHMIGGRRAGEDPGRYLPDSVAGWGFLLCCAGVVIWLHAAGTTWIGGAVILLMVMLFFLVVARIVAETGLVFVQINTPINRVWTYSAFDMRGLGVSGGALSTTPATFYHTSFFTTLFSNDMREALPVYATNSLRLGDLASYENEKRPSRTIGFFVALVLAVAVGYAVSGASTLYYEYAYATTMDPSQGRVNPYAFDIQEGTLGATNKYVKNLEAVKNDPNANLSDGYSRLGHFTFGAAVSSVMSVGRLRFINWPLHPVGFLLVYSFPMERVWFSIFIGWLAKVLVVKFGGIDLFRAARTFFIGLIVGEAGVAAFWLVVSIARFQMGLLYHPVNLLPT